MTKVMLPKGDTGLEFYSESADTLPDISTVTAKSSALRLIIQPEHVLKKLIFPNYVTIDSFESLIVGKALKEFPKVEGRVMVLHDLHQGIYRAGRSVTITLPTGELGVLFFKSHRGDIWLEEVKRDSQIYRQCLVSKLIGYYVESLVIPGQLELIGKDELQNVNFFLEKLKESAHVLNRIIVFKQKRNEVRNRQYGTRFDVEII